MRILIFSDNHPQSTSFIYQDYLAVSQAVDVRFVHSQSALNEDWNIVHVPFDFYSLRSKASWYLEKFGLAVTHVDSNFKSNLNAFINEFKPDLIHCQFAYEGIKIWDCIDNPQGHQFLFSFRGYDSTYKLRNKAYRKKINHIISQSNVHCHFVCNYLRSNLNKSGIETPRSRVIYTGIDVDHYSPLDHDKLGKGKVFLQVGSFNDKKGQEVTINAFKRFIEDSGRNDVSLRFVGSGRNIDLCKNLVDKLGLQERVFFLGKMDKMEIKRELQSADVFVHHSITAPNGDQEGLPNAVAEAMSMSLPVIATVHAGIPELVPSNADGVLVEEGDVPSYADAMGRMVDHPKSSVNRELILNQFTLNEHVSGFIEYYEIISNSKR